MTALVAASGARIPLAVDRWRRGVDEVEWGVLAPLDDPVLDVGCGPGRVVAAYAAAGRPALGIDVAPAAVAETTARGAAALQRSVFDRLPGEGRWGGVVLLDGNIGIGGDPVALLRRARTLLRVGGAVVVEVDAPGEPTERTAVRLELHRRRPSAWFPWATVAADRIDAMAADAGFADVVTVPVGDRWFTTAVRQ